MARVTVILPAKNAAPYIDTTLTTLLRQMDRPDDLALVAIDDGSTDETGEIMRQYAARLDSATVLVNDVAQGLATARNQGLAHVHTEHFAFLDGDDWMQPRRLQVLSDALRRLDTDFVRTDHVTVNGARRALVTAPYPWRNRVCPPRDGILPVNDASMVDYPYAWAGMFHRRVIDSGLAHFDDGLFTAEDRPWIWRLHLRARSFAVADAPAILYRRGVTGSLTQIMDRRQLDFGRAFSLAYELVAEDADAELYLPKLVTTMTAVATHHLRRSRSMPASVRRELRAVVGNMLAPVPRALLEGSLNGGSPRRRRLMAPFVRRAVA